MTVWLLGQLNQFANAGFGLGAHYGQGIGLFGEAL